VVGDVAVDFLSVDGDGSEAAVASALVGMRIVVLIGGEVPFQHGAAPVAGGSDDEVFDMPAKFFIELLRSAYPLLGEIDITVGMGFMHFGEGFDFSAIEVERGAVDVLLGFGIVQNGDGIVGAVGIMVVDNDFGGETGFAEFGPECFFNEVGLLL